LDIFAGEMSLNKNPNPPRLFIYENDGKANFKPILIHQGVPVHEAKVIDVGNSGRPSIVGKPYDPGQHVDLWTNKG